MLDWLMLASTSAEKIDWPTAAVYIALIAAGCFIAWCFLR